jgi:hypothetical protein
MLFQHALQALGEPFGAPHPVDILLFDRGLLVFRVFLEDGSGMTVNFRPDGGLQVRVIRLVLFGKWVWMLRTPRETDWKTSFVVNSMRTSTLR